jgi:hypothetical protein
MSSRVHPWLTLLWIALGVMTSACSGSARKRPDLPAPEYERPEVPPWDAGDPVDPFAAAAEGDWVDERDSAPDGGQEPLAVDAAANDAGAPAADVVDRPVEGTPDGGPG